MEERDHDQPIAAELLALLVCPLDRADLRVDGTLLICSACGREYPIEDGIPNLLVAEAS